MAVSPNANATGTPTIMSTISVTAIIRPISSGAMC